MRKILVATDGSDNSERALIEARRDAECTGGEVTILTIAESIGRYTTVGYVAAPVQEELEDSGKIILQNSLKFFDGFQGVVNTKIRKGNAADEIISEAENGEYELIVMGNRGLGAFSRTILGSVSNKVLNHANANVLIIK